MTLALRRAYHEGRLAGRDRDREPAPTKEGNGVGALLALLGTEGGRRRMLAAVDRARAGRGRPVDGPARYQMAELGMVLERCFFVPDDSVLLPSLLATARPAAASLAPILVAWLDADSGGGPDAPDGARAAPTRATLTPGRRAARTATAA